MERIAYIGLGGNLNDRVAALWAAANELRSRVDRYARFSKVYETQPRLNLEQPPFLNAVAELRTSWDAHFLLGQLHEIERALGRERSSGQRNQPRHIDLDLLLLGNLQTLGEGLRIPHPGMTSRRFVLVPLAELAPDLVPPGQLLTLTEILQACPDEGWVVPCAVSLDTPREAT